MLLGFIIISVFGAHAIKFDVVDDSAMHGQQDRQSATGPRKNMRMNWGSGPFKSCALKECATSEDCSDHLWHMLETLVDWFDANSVEYYVAFGTLLGAVRDQDIIPWTQDVDIFLTPSDQQKLLDNAKAGTGFAAGWNGIVRVCDAISIDDASFLQGSASLSSRFQFYAVSDAESRAMEWIPYYVDIYALETMGKEYVKVGGTAKWGNLSLDDVKKLHSPKEAGFVTIRGRQFKAPGNPEELLVAAYGPDWRTPLASHARAR